MEGSRELYRAHGAVRLVVVEIKLTEIGAKIFANDIWSRGCVASFPVAQTDLGLSAVTVRALHEDREI